MINFCNISIGTHDIVDVTIESVPLSVEAEYVSNSRAAGGMFIFLFASGAGDTVIDFTKSAYICLGRNESRSGHVLPFQLPAGEYFVSAYDIEESGGISSGLVYPADTVTHSQTGNAQSKQ